MRRPLPLAAFAAAWIAAGCAGHSSAPAATAPAAPAARTTRAAAARGDPTGIRYAPGAAKYHVEAATHQSQEVQGQTQGEVDITQHLYLSTALTQQAGNLGLAVTVDSVALTGAPAGADQAAALRGRTFNLLFTPSGRPLPSPADTSSPGMLQATQGLLQEFLPALPPVAITAGATWSDTVTRSTPTQGITINAVSHRQHRVAGWEDHGGVRALHITTVGDYTVTGTGEAQGQPVELSGGGHTTVERFISVAGLYLGSTQSDSSLINVNVLSAGITVDIHRTSRVATTRLP